MRNIDQTLDQTSLIISSCEDIILTTFSRVFSPQEEDRNDFESV